MLLATDSRVFNSIQETQRWEEWREHGQEIERHVFTPLILSTTRGMEREAQTFYKHLEDMLSHKREVTYSNLMGWLRCKLSFTILRSTMMCIRGSRSSRYHPISVPLTQPLPAWRTVCSSSSNWTTNSQFSFFFLTSCTKSLHTCPAVLFQFHLWSTAY